MAFKLVLSECSEEKRKEIGENVFLDNLPSESEVYLLYYPGAMPDKELENRLRALGESAGNNLFVNIGRLSDPSFRKIVKKFDINDFPVIIITANSKLASHPVGFETAYVKLDSKKLLKNPDLAIDCLQKLFLLFIQGEVSEALKQPGVYDRKATVARINNVVSGALKGVEFSVTMLGGILGVKWQG